MSLKRILITNDDGFDAPGIFHLRKALEGFFEVWMVAPKNEQSAKGLSLTIDSPLKVKKLSLEKTFVVNGTPADCVKLGLSRLMDSPPDLIVSGINCGSNAGRNVLYSGTVGGVIEGVFRGIPGIAFSCSDHNEPAFEKAEPFILPIVNFVLDHCLPRGTLLNVNFPSPRVGIKGIRMARQGRGYAIEDPDLRQHPSGADYYWLGFKILDFEEHPESDVAILQEGYVSVAPVHIDELTDEAYLKKTKESFDRLF